MINQDEVFVITEDDILKPSEKGKGKNGAGAKAAPAKAQRGSEKAKGAEETVFESTPVKPLRRGSRSPAAAGTLSLFVWGLGQFYNGDVKIATLFLLCEMFVIAFHYMLIMTWDRIRTFAHLFFVNEWEMFLYASSLDFCLIFFMIYNVAQAYRGAQERGGQHYAGLHSPVLAGVASVIVPGWGQILNGQLGKAIVFLFSFLLQIYLLGLYLLSPFYRVMLDLEPDKILVNKAARVGMAILFATALSWILGIYDAVIVARYTRRLKN